MSNNSGGKGPQPSREESSITSDVADDELQVDSAAQKRPPPIPAQVAPKAPTPPPPPVKPTRSTLPTPKTPKTLPPPPAVLSKAADGADDPTLKLPPVTATGIPRPIGKSAASSSGPLPAFTLTPNPVPSPLAKPAPAATPAPAPVAITPVTPPARTPQKGAPAITPSKPIAVHKPEAVAKPAVVAIKSTEIGVASPLASKGASDTQETALFDELDAEAAEAIDDDSSLATQPLELQLASETLAKATAHPIATMPGATSLAAQRARGQADAIERHLRAARGSESSGPSTRVGRLLVEQGMALERAADWDGAQSRYQEAITRAPTFLPALIGARRARLAKPADLPTQRAALLDLIDREMRLADGPDARADLLAERARVHERFDGDPAAIIEAFREALTLKAQHAESLFGLDGALRAAIGRTPNAETRTALEKDLAEHLARMAGAYGQQPELVAACHAARAQILERHRDFTAAEEAYAAALAADGRVGPIREAYKRLLWSRGAWARLRDVLAEEAGREHDLARSVRLLHHAARLSTERLGDPAQAITLLGAAASRAPTDPGTDARVLEELARLLDERGDAKEAAEVRRRRVAQESDPAIRALDWRRLGATYDQLGDAQQAAAALEYAREIEPLHVKTLFALDRLHAKRNDHEARVRIWLDEAAKAREPARRATAYVRAARITEDQLRRVDDALELLRAAWVTDTGNLEAFDELTRMMLPPAEMRQGVGGSDGRNARALIELFAQAAEVTREPARKIAYLEKIAALWEDALGEPARAADLYLRVLTIDPARRFAILGLQRAHERSGDFRGLAEAIEREATLSADPSHKDALLLRAAEVWSKRAGDADRATDLIGRVLEKNPEHAAALRALLEAHEAKGRDAEVADVYGKLIALARKAGRTADVIALCLELGELLRTRLGRLDDAIATFREVRAIDPQHPIATRELAYALRARSRWREVAELEESLAEATAAEAPTTASLSLVRAAEVWEDRLNDDPRAQSAYARALQIRPDDLSAWEGLARLAERRGALRELESAYRLRIEREHGATRQTLRVALADLLLRRHAAGETAAGEAASVVLDSILAEAPTHVPSLRASAILHHLFVDHDHATASSYARILTLFAQALRDPLAKRGVLWELSRLQEARLPASPPIAAYLLIFESDPHDRAALAAIARLGTLRLFDGAANEKRSGRDGLPDVRALVAFAIRRSLQIANDPGLAIGLELRLAEVLEDSLEKREVGESLSLYRAALARDPMSPTAIAGVLRVGALVEDRAAMLEGERAAANLWLSLADAKTDAIAHLLRASSLAEQLSAGQGGGDAVALELARHALRVDADSVEAASAVSALLRKRKDARTLVDLFMEAASIATRPERVLALAREGADAAKNTLGNIPVAVALLSRAREVAPSDVLLACDLGDLYFEQRAWAEAAECYHDALDDKHGAPALAVHIRAHRALASLYEGALADPAAALSALRALVRLDPRDVGAHRKLAEMELAAGDVQAAEATVDALLAIGGLSLEDHVRGLDQKAELRLAAGDKKGAERALRQALRLDPDVERLAFAHLATFHQRHGNGDAGLAAALAEMCEAPGADPRWRIKLAELSIHRLGRPEDGIAQLRAALGGMVTAATPRALRTAARLALADGLMTLGANDEAQKTLRDVLADNPTDARGLEAAHRALTAMGRREESFVVDEVRAFLGHTQEAAVFRSRRSVPGPLRPQSLEDTTIYATVLPSAAKHPALEVLTALFDQLGKVVPPDLATLGLTSRDRIGTRSGQPLRNCVDRAASVLGIPEIDLYVQGASDAFFYVENTDPPAVVAARWMTELPELEMSFAMARMVAKIAMKVNLIDKLPQPKLEALIYLALEPFGVAPPRAWSPDDEELGRRVHKAISRKTRRTLEDIAPRFINHVRGGPGNPGGFDIARFCYAIEQAASRVGYLLTGDLTTALDHLHRFDPDGDLSGENVHAADLLRFSLGPDAPVLRRRIGTTWA